MKARGAARGEVLESRVVTVPQATPTAPKDAFFANNFGMGILRAWRQWGGGESGGMR
jgi:hypothetical protein